MDTTTHHSVLDPTELAAARDAAGHGATGRLGEDLAAHHLTADDGLTIVARNWRLAVGELRGELDIVAVDEAAGCVAVCEVKTRRDAARFGGAVMAVSPRKRARLRTLTAAFLRDASLPFRHVRLDLVAVDLGRDPTLTHLVDAL